MFNSWFLVLLQNTQLLKICLELSSTYLIKHHPYPAHKKGVISSAQTHTVLSGSNTAILSKEEMAVEARSSQSQLGATEAGSQYLLLPTKK